MAEPPVTARLLTVTVNSDDGTAISFKTQSRMDAPIEIGYHRDGGILRAVLKKLPRD